jgi:spore coat-associated protein N
MMDDLLQEMIDPAPAHRDAPRRRRLWTTVAIVGLAAIGATTLTTSAIFSDNDAASADIKSGTVDLVVGDGTTFAFTPQNLAPGDATFAPLQVSSSGSLELRYSVSYKAEQSAADAPAPDLAAPDGSAVATDGDLRDVLQLRLYAVPAAQCNLAGTGGATTPSTPLNDAGTITPWPGIETPLVGSNAPGQQAGDRVLSVATPTEMLCARVDFPSTAGNEYQAGGVTLDLTFNAEQTVHNP